MRCLSTLYGSGHRLAHRANERDKMLDEENFNFLLNGENVSVAAPSDMPLLWVIRDLLKHTEVKYSCGIAQCGACTIHLNGKAVRSCVTPVSEAQGQRVVTLADRATTPNLTRVKEEWKKKQVPQCGYCQPGQIMSACALLNANPSASDEEIKRGMSGNLCRCGTYPRILSAIRSLTGRPE